MLSGRTKNIKLSYEKKNQNEVDRLLLEAYKNATSDHHNKLLKEIIVMADYEINNYYSSLKEFPELKNYAPTNIITIIDELQKSLELTISAQEKREKVNHNIEQFKNSLKKFYEIKTDLTVQKLLLGNKV